MHGFIPGRLERITEHFTRHYVEPGKIAGCQLLIARGGVVAYQSELGVADRERGKALESDTIFRIYSMTKPITAVALLILFEEGRFRLDDPVHRLLPSWREQRVWVSGAGDNMQTEPAKRAVTMRDLLCHTAGLTYGNALRGLDVGDSAHPVDQAYGKLGIDLARSGTVADFAAKMGKVPLRYQPGEGWMYSVATDVCGALVEVLSGQSFDRFLRERILDPLGMRDTAFSVPGAKLARFAACYRRSRDKRLLLSDDPLTSVFREEPTFFSGGGGLVGTTADYLRFCEMLRRHGELDGVRILSPRAVRLMRANHLPAGQDIARLSRGLFVEPGNEGIGFGLGVATMIDPVRAGSLSDAEYYWAGAASTLFWIDPVADLVVIFMTQLTPARAFDFRGQLRSLVYSALAE